MPEAHGGGRKRAIRRGRAPEICPRSNCRTATSDVGTDLVSRSSDRLEAGRDHCQRRRKGERERERIRECGKGDREGRGSGLPRESSVTIAACFRRSSSCQRHSTALSNDSPSLPPSLSLSLCHPFFYLAPMPASTPNGPSRSLTRITLIAPRPLLCPDVLSFPPPPPLFPPQSPLHFRSPLETSSTPSTPKYCNFSLAAA